MKKKVLSIVNGAITFTILTVAFLTPLLYFNQFTEFYETPKLIFLIFSTLILTALWITTWVLKGRFEITKTPLDIPLLILAIAVIGSTFLSASKFISIYGNFPRVHGSAVSWITYILLYFVVVSNLKSIRNLKLLLYSLYAGASIISIVGLLSFFNIFLPFNLTRAASFTPAGPTFSAIALLMILLPLPLLSLTNTIKAFPKYLGLLLSILFSSVIILMGSLPLYIILLIIYLFVYLFKKRQPVSKGSKNLFFVPAVIALFFLAMSYLPLSGNPVYNLYKNFPREIQLPIAISWKISASTFIDTPYLGTGPSTFLYDFTAYKPLEYNNLNFWNFSFDTAYNEFLQVLATLGVVGFVVFIIVCAVILGSVRYLLLKKQSEDTSPVSIALAISSVASVLLFTIHTTTIVSIVITLLVFALFLASQKSVRDRLYSFGSKQQNLEVKKTNLLPFIFLVLFLIGAGFVSLNTYNAALADYYHRQSLLEANTSGNKTYEHLQKAESLNPYIDLYRVDMAQTNFAIANALANQKGPSSQNPSGTLTDQDKKTIQTLISQSINEGRVAVTLNPASARNWEILASIYRNITAVAQNANTFSLDAYGRAIKLDPLNPNLRLSVGGLYYSMKNYDLAIRFYTDAANIKPDYANAYFNLAIALRDKGDLQNAKNVAEQTVKLLSDKKDTNDYKVAINLVKELTDRLNSSPQNQTQEKNQAKKPLDNTKVNIDSLTNPPELSTPSAIKNNPDSNLPTISLSPTKTP